MKSIFNLASLSDDNRAPASHRHDAARDYRSRAAHYHHGRLHVL